MIQTYNRKQRNAIYRRAYLAINKIERPVICSVFTDITGKHWRTNDYRLLFPELYCFEPKPKDVRDQIAWWGNGVRLPNDTGSRLVALGFMIAMTQD